MEAELGNKERVIREPDQAGRERLSLIKRFVRRWKRGAMPGGPPATPSGGDAGPGMANFFSPHYQEHNRARLAHLDSLGIPVSGRRVLELGSGPGDHTGFYITRQCEVVSVDSRQECTDALAQRFPGVRTKCCDLNEPDLLLELGRFDVVHCYGILYHLEKPAELLRYMGEACTGVAIVETCVSAAKSSTVELADEIHADYTQSSTGRASRPTRQWVFEELGRYFPFVYHTRTQPAHPEFPTDWNNLQGTPPLIRSVFVASKNPLGLPTLSSELLDVQSRFG